MQWYKKAQNAGPTLQDAINYAHKAGLSDADMTSLTLQEIMEGISAKSLLDSGQQHSTPEPEPSNNRSVGGVPIGRRGPPNYGQDPWRNEKNR